MPQEVAIILILQLRLNYLSLAIVSIGVGSGALLEVQCHLPIFSLSRFSSPLPLFKLSKHIPRIYFSNMLLVTFMIHLPLSKNVMNRLRCCIVVLNLFLRCGQNSDIAAPVVEGHWKPSISSETLFSSFSIFLYVFLFGK